MKGTQAENNQKISTPDRRAIFASAIGNCLELFDLTVFGFFAAVIGSQFFPNDDPAISLLSSFASFALGFLMRPAGALLLAPLGDRLGRKRLLAVTMGLMGIASLGIAVLPTYSNIGILAPVLLVLFRLLQGFAAGGEWGGAVSMMIEHSPPHRRGLVGSLQQVGFGLGILAGTTCAFALNNTLSADQLASWGWRIPFLLGAVVAPIAYYIRRHVNESPEFISVKRDHITLKKPVSEAFRNHSLGMACVIGMGTVGTSAGYIANQFMNNYASGNLHIETRSVSGLIMLASILQTLLIPFWGWVSDKIGRVQVMGAAALIYFLAIYPLFAWLSDSASVGALFVMVMSSAILVSASFGPLPALISEFFPAHIRTTAISIGYNFAAAIFGGLAPVICTELVRTTGNLNSPTYYAIGCAFITLATTTAILVSNANKNRIIQEAI